MDKNCFQFPLKNPRLENRRRLSRLVLGNRIDNPKDFFGTASYALLKEIPIGRIGNENETTNISNDGNDKETTATILSPSAVKENEGVAFDSIVVESSDGKLHHANENGDSWFFSAAFSVAKNGFCLEMGQGDEGIGYPATALVMKLRRGDENGDAWFQIHEADDELEDNIVQKDGGNNDREIDNRKRSWEELKPLLREGANYVAFCCLRHTGINEHVYKTTTVQFARSSIWLWKASDRVVISDIDGTLTKSNVQGVLGTILTNNYETVSHAGICHLLSSLVSSSPPNRFEGQSSTRVVYLTSRPIHLAHKTREFLSGLTQQEGDGEPRKSLPAGPLLGFGGNLARVLAMEVLSKTTQAFKAEQLEKHISGPLRRARAHESTKFESDIFVAAFGNNLNDVQAYHKIGMDLDRVFMIDKKSKIVTFDKPPPIEGTPPKGEDGFPPHSWYKQVMGTIFEDGYSDAKLHFLLGVINGGSDEL